MGKACEHDENLWKDAEQSEAEKNIGVHQSIKGQFTTKYLIFLRNVENSLYCPNFPCVLPKFPVFSLSGKIDNQIPCFPCAVATLFYVGILKMKFPWHRL